MRTARIATTLVLMAAILMVSVPAAAADDPEARGIMEKVDARDDGDNQTADMEMILIDKKGKKRLRRISVFRKEKAEDDYRLMLFQHPADVKNTGFLTYDYDDPKKDDDQWLYLPALRKTKRIATSDKSGSFMGSDLNYSDMTSRNLEDYDYSFYEKQKEVVVRGVKTWVIESKPRSKDVIEETGYRKALLFVRQDNYVVVRAKSWEESKGHIKYMDVTKLDEIDGIWVSTEMRVTRKRGNTTVHKTVLRLANVRFDQQLGHDLFTTRRLEKGL